MPITLENVGDASDKIREVQELSSQLQEVMVILENTPILSDKAGNVQIDLSIAQKGQLLAEYEKRKQALLTASNNLL